MKNTVTKSQFIDAFENKGRGGSFSYAGFSALFDYLEELEDDCGTEIELDPVAFDCEYAEYTNLASFRDDYFADTKQAREELNADEDTEEDELDELTREYIHDNGQLIEFEGGLIVSNF